MARTGKAKAILAKARAVRDDEKSVLDSREAVTLAARFKQVREEGAEQLVDLAAALGAILHEARVHLRGQYHRWLDERLGLDRGTARNYSALAALARESPAIITRHKRLGVTKLYTLARMAPASRHQLLREPRLADMGDREFRALTSPLLLRTRKVTGNMRGHGLRMKVRAMYEALTAG